MERTMPLTEIRNQCLPRRKIERTYGKQRGRAFAARDSEKELFMAEGRLEGSLSKMDLGAPKNPPKEVPKDVPSPTLKKEQVQPQQLGDRRRSATALTPKKKLAKVPVSFSTWVLAILRRLTTQLALVTGCQSAEASSLNLPPEGATFCRPGQPVDDRLQDGEDR